MSFTQDECRSFLADPPGWLDSVAISVSNLISTPSVKGKPDKLTFRPSAGSGFRSAGSKETPIPVYMLSKAKEDEVSFDAYIAEYVQGKTTPTMLGGDASLCFTANMNGCTFGIGTQATPADSLLVSHGNAAGSKGLSGLAGVVKPSTILEIQNSVQHTWAREVHGTGQVFEPEHYRTGGRQSITFGWREQGKKWKFFFQSYEKVSGSKWLVHGVNPVGTNQILDHSTQ
ncbi:MAG: hypothetical protein O3A63_12735 [Proteobacteria bacterium]|nr:hypothetical protein [Pseudomonadota bacterium]